MQGPQAHRASGVDNGLHCRGRSVAGMLASGVSMLESATIDD